MARKHPYTTVFRGEVRICQMWGADPDRLRRMLMTAAEPPDEATFLRCQITVARMMHIDCLVDRSTRNQGFEVSAAWHDRLIGRRHGKKVRDLLRECRIIRRIGGYLPGSHCFHYRMAPWCWSTALEQLIPIPIRPPREEKMSGPDEGWGGHPREVMEHIGASLRELGFPRGFGISDHIASLEVGNGRIQGNARGRNILLQGETTRRAAARKIAFESFINEPDRITVSSATGRVFHPVATMPRDLRHKLQFAGEPVAEIDIANCQPLLFALLLRDGSAGNRVPINEIESLLSVAASGQFYEHVQQLGSSWNVVRDRIKVEICRDLFFGWRHGRHTRVFEVFGRAYPSVAAAIQELHDRTKAGGTTLACLLQREESRLMYEVMAPALMAAMPGMPFVSVHDSVLVPASRAARVVEVVKDAIKRSRGVEPTVKCEAWGAEVPEKDMG